MNGLARELYHWITKNGYGTFEGLTGSTHLKYRLRNGQIFTTGSTPSAPSAVLNAKNDVRKILGLKNEGPNAGTYTHKKTDGYDGTGKRVTGHYAPGDVQHRQNAIRKIDDELARLGPRGNVDRVRQLARKRLMLAKELEELGVIADPPKLTSPRSGYKS